MGEHKLTGPELGRISPWEYASLPPTGIVVAMENVRSAHNVGSAFRSCDAFRADRLLLCGITACPPSAEIHKTALGAEFSVPWEKCGSAVETIEQLRKEGYLIVAVEQTEHSLSLDAFTPEEGSKYVLVFGNEVDGVSQAVVDSADFCLEIPQFGSKHSLNVSVAVGVVLWSLTEKRL